MNPRPAFPDIALQDRGFLAKGLVILQRGRDIFPGESGGGKTGLARLRQQRAIEPVHGGETDVRLAAQLFQKGFDATAVAAQQSGVASVSQMARGLDAPLHQIALQHLGLLTNGTVAKNGAEGRDEQRDGDEEPGAQRHPCLHDYRPSGHLAGAARSGAGDGKNPGVRATSRVTDGCGPSGGKASPGFGARVSARVKPSCPASIFASSSSDPLTTLSKVYTVKKPWTYNTSHLHNQRSRLALLTTVTEDSAIAAPAIIGLSSRPVKGYSIPAAMGMLKVL